MKKEKNIFNILESLCRGFGRLSEKKINHKLPKDVDIFTWLEWIFHARIYPKKNKEIKDFGWN